MIEEEKGHLDALLKEIAALEQERVGLLKELGQDDKQEDCSDQNFLQIMTDLKERVDGLRAQKEERMVKVNVVLDRYLTSKIIQLFICSHYIEISF